MKLLNCSLCFFFIPLIIWGQSTIDPFLAIRPYQAPRVEQYPPHAQFDHYYPTQTSNYVFINFTGDSSSSVDPPAVTCIDGINCYDGHAGYDYWMPRNTPLLAAAPGTIVWAAFENVLDTCPNGLPANGELGVVIIDHENGYYSAYLHVDPPIPVEVGDRVQTGDTVAFNGDTGCAGTPHLHFEVRKDSYYYDALNSWAVNPYGWWGATRDPVSAMRGNSSTWLWKSSPLIDDGDNGFERFYGPNWNRLEKGYNGDAWEMPAVHSAEASRHFALWVPELEKAGLYDIQIYVPGQAEAVDKAIYELYIKKPGGTNQKSTVVVDQRAAPDSFMTIASAELPAGANCALIIRDVVPADSRGNRVLVDAVRFVLSATAIGSRQAPEAAQNRLDILSAFPNPMQPSQGNQRMTFVFKLAEKAPVNIIITNILGQKIKAMYLGVLSTGIHQLQWNWRDDGIGTLSNGVYFCTIMAGSEIRTRKFLILMH